MATSAVREATTREQLVKLLRATGKAIEYPKGLVITNPDRTSNIGAHLHQIYIWQEIAKMAENELKLAWDAAQAEDGICDDDDSLREHGVGETEICNSKHYALVIDVKTPAQRVDGVTFYKALAKAFKTTVAAIERIAGKAKVDNKASLTKRVVERV